MFIFKIHWCKLSHSFYKNIKFLFSFNYNILVPFSFVLIYTYYHGIIDHSGNFFYYFPLIKEVWFDNFFAGITFKRLFWQPWQPDCIFHDNHHQYFHVNFGFNIEYWDKVSVYFLNWWAKKLQLFKICHATYANILASWNIQTKGPYLHRGHLLWKRKATFWCLCRRTWSGRSCESIVVL